MKPSIKTNFLSGVVVIAPIAVTFYVILWVYRRVAALPSAEVLRVTPYGAVNDLIQATFSLGVVFVGLVVVGFLIRTAFGDYFKDELDRLANRIPVVRLVYNTTKLGIETVVGGASEFKRPVKIDYEGLRFTAFKTGGKTDDGREVIFLPTAPNITSGFVIEIDPDRFEEADETVEDALTRILSAGFGTENNRVENIVQETAKNVQEAESDDD